MMMFMTEVILKIMSDKLKKIAYNASMFMSLYEKLGILIYVVCLKGCEIDINVSVEKCNKWL